VGREKRESRFYSGWGRPAGGRAFEKVSTPTTDEKEGKEKTTSSLLLGKKKK